jgi:hypothetical protein
MKIIHKNSLAQFLGPDVKNIAQIKNMLDDCIRCLLFYHNVIDWPIKKNAAVSSFSLWGAMQGWHKNTSLPNEPQLFSVIAGHLVHTSPPAVKIKISHRSILDLFIRPYHQKLYKFSNAAERFPTGQDMKNEMNKYAEDIKEFIHERMNDMYIAIKTPPGDAVKTCSNFYDDYNRDFQKPSEFQNFTRVVDKTHGHQVFSQKVWKKFNVIVHDEKEEDKDATYVKLNFESDAVTNPPWYKTTTEDVGETKDEDEDAESKDEDLVETKDEDTDKLHKDGKYFGDFINMNELSLKPKKKVIFETSDYGFLKGWLTKKTLNQLQTNGWWFNDSVIDLYMKTLNNDVVHCFNVFFTKNIKTLTEGKSVPEKNYMKVLTQALTKSTKYLLFPYNLNGNHWVLYIYHVEHESYYYYDSKQGKPHVALFEKLKKIQYIKTTQKDPIQIMNGPHQEETDNSSCGPRICMYAKYIAQNKTLTESKPQNVSRKVRYSLAEDVKNFAREQIKILIASSDIN